MNRRLREDADRIIGSAISAVMPGNAVRRALLELPGHEGRTFIAAIGKAAWQMAYAASEVLPSFYEGIVITKYGHVEGEIPGISCFEAGHPVPDENSFRATEKLLDMISDLKEGDLVIFLISGGGSALFEKPLVPAEELEDITNQLLASGASITEMNTIRKRLSAVKGGRFAKACEPAHLFCIVLSDIIGDPLDMIASGPASADTSTCEEALTIAEKYGLRLSEKAKDLLKEETPKEISNAEFHITGSVRELCSAASEACRELGYETIILTDRLQCEAAEAGRYLGSIAASHSSDDDPGTKKAFIAGGETVVHLSGTGKGGRNQELALAAAPLIAGAHNTAVFSFGSDGTDGPTDAAGGYVDGDSLAELEAKGFNVDTVLAENDSYTALGAVGGLIITGPTGTNVNDAAIALVSK